MLLRLNEKAQRQKALTDTHWRPMLSELACEAFLKYIRCADFTFGKRIIWKQRPRLLVRMLFGAALATFAAESRSLGYETP